MEHSDIDLDCCGVCSYVTQNWESSKHLNSSQTYQYEAVMALQAIPRSMSFRWKWHSLLKNSLIPKTLYVRDLGTRLTQKLCYLSRDFNFTSRVEQVFRFMHNNTAIFLFRGLIELHFLGQLAISVEPIVKFAEYFWDRKVSIWLFQLHWNCHYISCSGQRCSYIGQSKTA